MMIFVVEFASIENVENIAAVDLLLCKLPQRSNEKLRGDVLVRQKPPDTLCYGETGTRTCRNGQSRGNTLGMLHRLTDYHPETICATLVIKIKIKMKRIVPILTIFANPRNRKIFL
jgi:hypothetical protein